MPYLLRFERNLNIFSTFLGGEGAWIRTIDLRESDERKIDSIICFPLEDFISCYATC
jgi:hypothetical protein